MTHALAEPPQRPDYRFLVSVIVAMVLAGVNVVQATTGDVPLPTFPLCPPAYEAPAPPPPVEPYPGAWCGDECRNGKVLGPAPTATAPHPPVIYDENGEPANEDDSP